MAFGVTLMPANPVSPLRAVKAERYAPGGGSKAVGAIGDDAVDPHAPMSSAPTMSGAVRMIDPSRGKAAAFTGLFVIGIPSTL
jgi:hypothetical protein